MNRSIILVLGISSILVAAACEDSPKTDQKPQAPTAAQVTIADEDLAVPADFEDEAAKTITVATYKAELDALESELN